jgi:hypothetical protein
VSIKLQIELDYAGGRAYNEDGDSHPIDIDEAIVLAAADALLGQLKRDEMYRTLQRRVHDTQDELIREAVAPLVVEAINGALQPTDSWGNPKGEPITLAEHITKIGVEYLTKETGDYSRRETVIRKFIREEIDRKVQGELKAALEQAKAEVIAAVKEQGAELMATTIAKMAGVS